MSVLDTVKNRRSVRTFDGTGLRPEDAQRIMEYAEKAGAACQSEERLLWRFLPLYRAFKEGNARG